MKYENCLLSNWEATAAGLQYCCSPLYPEPDDCFLRRLSLKKRGICIYTEHIELWEKRKSMSLNVDRKAKHELVVVGGGWVRPLRVSTDPPPRRWSWGNHQIISCCLRVWVLAWRKVSRDDAVSLHSQTNKREHKNAADLMCGRGSGWGISSKRFTPGRFWVTGRENRVFKWHHLFGVEVTTLK